MSQKYFSNPAQCIARIKMQEQFKLLQKIIKSKKQQFAHRPRDPIFSKVFVGWDQDGLTQKKRVKTEVQLIKKPINRCQIYNESQEQLKFTNKQEKDRTLYSKSVQLPYLHKNNRQSYQKSTQRKTRQKSSDFLLYKPKSQQIGQQQQKSFLIQENSEDSQTQQMKKKLLQLAQKVFKYKPIKQTETNKSRVKAGLTKKELKLAQVKKKLKKHNKQSQWQQVDVLTLQTYFLKLLKSKSKSRLHVIPQSQQQNKHQNKHISAHICMPNRSQIPQFVRQYIPRSTNISIDELVKRQNFKIVIDDDHKSLYFGEIVNDKRSGFGVLVGKENVLYEGIWHKGSFVQGYQIGSQGYYKGKFKDGKRNGQGQFQWNNGQSYQGQWKNGLKQGSGVWQSGKGDSYIGQWTEGKVQGYGVHVTANEQRYEGFFKQFLKHGKGKQSFPNGDTYQGEYKNGKPNGKGRYIWKNKVFYEGQFVDSKRQGKGKMEAPFFMKYIGEFSEDKPHGKGQIIYENDDNYIGQFKQGQKDGYGTLKLKRNHQILSGVWHRNQFKQDSSQNQQQQQLA